MKFTDVFIKRPVLSTVVGSLIVLLGVRGVSKIAVRELPTTSDTVITVTTEYAGASQELVQRSITAPIQNALGSVAGLDYLASISVPGQSRIEAHIESEHDPRAVLAEIMSEVAGVEGQLPQNARPPLIRKRSSAGLGTLYLGFYSETLSLEQITEYLARVAQPLLQAAPGVAEVEVLGSATHAMRVWLNPQAMAARQVTPSEVLRALKTHNYQAATEQIEGFTVASIIARSDLGGTQQLEEVLIGQRGNALVRIKDIAKVELGSRSHHTEVLVRGRPAVALQIAHGVDANPLDVVDAIKQRLPVMAAGMPEGLQHEVLLDQTTSIRASIEDASRTLLLTVAIVLFIVFLLTGSGRAALIALIAILLSLCGALGFIEALGLSVSLMTLLAMVIAVALLVDDAIVVIDNVLERVGEGKSPFAAAILGARELWAPMATSTVVSAAWFASMGFVGGPLGALCSGLAWTLTASAVVSGIVALTVSSRLSAGLSKARAQTELPQKVASVFDELRRRYENALDDALQYRPVVLLWVAVALASIPILLRHTAVELVPVEDEGIILAQGTGPSYAGLDYTSKHSQDAARLFEDVPESAVTFSVAGLQRPNTALVATSLKPWDERKRSQHDIRMDLQRELQTVPAMDFHTLVVPPLPGSEIGLPVQFVITNELGGHEETYKVMTAMEAKAKESGKFLHIDHSLRFGKPQIELQVRADLAASLGISMAEIGQALALAYGDNAIGDFDTEGRRHALIPQIAREFRLSKDMINQVYVPTQQGDFVPLGTVVELTQTVKPNALQQFDQLDSATISLLPLPWVSMRDAVTFFEDAAEQVFPEGFGYDFKGESRQFVQQGHALVRAILFAAALVFLILAARFESWRDASAIMLSLPVAMSGALIFLQAGVSTLNIYSEMALLGLTGLLSKQAVHMVELANRLQEKRGLQRMEAIRQASSARLRPVLMTTFAVVFAMIPLILKGGASAEAHRSIGWVLLTGLPIGAGFTLFVLPVLYSYISKPKTSAATPSVSAPPARREDDDTPAASLVSGKIEEDAT